MQSNAKAEPKQVAPAQRVLPPPLPSAEQPRDTDTAVDAMQLAHAYIAEFHDKLSSVMTDPALAATVLNTLSLVSRQLEIAERADPSATLTVEHEDGTVATFTLTEMKGNALFYEGLCRSVDNPKRAIQILEQALQLMPDSATTSFWIGMFHAEMLNKARAVAAFEQTVALDPRDIDYRKELLRAQSISGAQIAFDRAAGGVRTTVSVAKWAWFGFWVIAIVSFVAAIIRGDPGPAVAIFFIFIVFGAALRGVDMVKGWFKANTW